MEEQSYSEYMAEMEAQQPNRLQRFGQTLRSVGHKIAQIPVVNFLSVFFVPTMFTAAGNLFDSLGSVTKGKWSEGAKNLVAGMVDTLATEMMSWNYISSGSAIWWSASGVTALTTGDSLPEMLRTGTKSVLDSIDGSDKPQKALRRTDPLLEYARSNQVLGMQPQIMGANVVGMGYAPGVPQQPMMPQPMMQPMAQPAPQAMPQPMPQPAMPAAYGPQPETSNYWTNTVAPQQGQQTPDPRQAGWAQAQQAPQSYREMLATREQQAAAAALQPQRG